MHGAGDVDTQETVRDVGPQLRGNSRIVAISDRLDHPEVAVLAQPFEELQQPKNVIAEYRGGAILPAHHLSFNLVDACKVDGDAPCAPYASPVPKLKTHLAAAIVPRSHCTL